MRLTPSAAAMPAETLRPVRAGLARMVVALRPAIAVMVLTSAAISAVPPVSWAWLGPALGGLLAWTALYTTVGWTRGLRPWLVVADLGVAAALALAAGHLVPAAEIDGMTSWVSLLTSMTVISAQLASVLALSLPASMLVLAAEAAGQRMAHAPDGGLATLAQTAAQVLVATGVMVIGMQIERSSVRALSRLMAAQAAAACALASREDERAQLRLLHNGPLTTLTMALHAGASATLRQRAAAALTALPVPGEGGAESGDGEVRLDERLPQVVVWYDPPLRVSVRLHPALVPAAVADAMAGAASEALENVARYAGTDQAAVELSEDDGAVRVTVTDRGRGFDPAGAAGQGFGLREDLAGRMSAVGGTAAVRSIPGTGTRVDLEWRRG